MVSGALTKSMQTLIANPIIIIKTRLEVIGFNEYAGIRDACRQIYAKEGLGAFFTGLKVSLIRDVPFSGIFYPIYSFFRVHLTEVYDYEMSGHPNVSPAERMKAIAMISSIAAMLANVVSCTVTHPLDLIRTRLYFKYYNTDVNQNYSGILNGIEKIYANDGLRGFFKGLFPRIMRKGLGSVICWSIYEFLIDKQDMIMEIG